MPKKSKANNPFIGLWRIVSMSAWDEDYLNEESQAYIKFDTRKEGEFHFGYVHGFMDSRLTTKNGEPAVEWTWDGNDEMEPAQGRGWALIRAAELHGMIFFHQGDESEFTAKMADLSKGSDSK
jgi:hypothetical protein